MTRWWPPSRMTAVLAVGVVLAIATALLQWQIHGANRLQAASDASLRAAGETSAAILSYTTADVETGLSARTERLTGDFLKEYTELMTTEVIPEAKRNNVTATATVAGAAAVSATTDRAVNLLFIDQTVSKDPPGAADAPAQPARSTFSVRVTLEKIGERWLISGFEPV